MHWSEGVVKAAVWLSGQVPFAQAAAILQRLGRVNMSAMSIWRCSQTWGSQLCRQAEGERGCANALPEPWASPKQMTEPPQRLGVGMDGAMIHLRQEGWKELKLGTLFAVAVSSTVDPTTNECVDLAQAVNSSYVAHLGGPERLGEFVWAEAQRRGWEYASDTLAIGDGAPWIWNQVALHFGDSHQLVDWYHAKQHLTEAARLLKGEGPAAQRWLNSRETLLYQGHAERIANELGAASDPSLAYSEKLAKEANYFRQNQWRMNYLEMREQEWPIGSGMVESGAKQFKARFCGPGMRWSRSGAENLIPIRTAILSHRFDELWTKVYHLPPA
jgi:hypothetical protein